ncbi:COX15/CtaA family protein [Gynuella sp.]|uniref:COX15/CtaA family protein n=1 Tax=Gynuella sp. TaxID=2969146 RepID=UPI003D0EEBD4
MTRLANVRPGFRLALFATAFALAVVALGAFTRLSDAGLGCPDWPGCYGHFWAPTSDTAIAKANQSYPDMPVDLSKTWPEMVHRYLASGLGVLIIALTVVCIYFRRLDDQPVKLPVLLLLFVVLQGFFGMWTVTLKLWPQVVTAHLLGGFTTFCLLWLLTLRLSGWQSGSHSQINLPRKIAMIALGLAIFQVMLGGWTTSNYAALACSDFPLCYGDDWWPQADFSHGFNIFQHIGPNYLGGALHAEGRIAIHWSHRLGAVLVGLACYWLAWRLWQQRLAVLAGVLVTVVSGQILLGISNVVFVLPLPVAVAHNVVGAVLVATLVTVNYRLFQEVKHGCSNYPASSSDMARLLGADQT